MVKNDFLGGCRTQRAYFAALDIWNSGKVFLGTSVKIRTTDHGKPTDFLARYWQLDLLRGEHNDVRFMG